MVTAEKENKLLDLLTRFLLLSKIARILGYIMSFVRKCITQSPLDDQAAIKT